MTLLAFHSLAAMGVYDWGCGAWTPPSSLLSAHWLLWHILRWEGLVKLGLVSRYGRLDIQSPLVPGGVGKKSDLNLRYVCFFSSPVEEAQLPGIWALFWYSYCWVSLSSISFFCFSFFICNVMKTGIKGAVLGNCLLTAQPFLFLYGDSSLSKVSLSCWLGV